MADIFNNPNSITENSISMDANAQGFDSSYPDSERLEVLDVQSKLGRPNLIIGPTGVGKSALLNSLLTPAAARILKVRECNGQGTRSETRIAITDCELLPKEKIFVSGNISNSEVDDDGKLVGEICYSLSREISMAKGKPTDLKKKYNS
ncbi:MAG: hypothetical protein ACI4JY_02400, partial [Oscillospiraceae bacterium]